MFLNKIYVHDLVIHLQFHLVLDKLVHEPSHKYHEKWELLNDLPFLLKSIAKILSNNPIFIILNSYAIRSSHISLHYGLSEAMQNYSGKVESGEISIVEEQDNPRQISTAIFARWEKEEFI